MLPALRSARESGHCIHSALWGERGESWKPEGVLPDFSYAGYHAGEAPIPDEPARWNLKRDFKARGDGISDDTAAFEAAITTAAKGVLFIPGGKYLITRSIAITNTGVVIRGAGAGKTILYFAKSLSDIRGNQPDESGYSQWSFGPGLIDVQGNDDVTPGTRLAAVVRVAKRGDHQLELSNPIKVAPGEWIRVAESDPPVGTPGTGSLIHFLFGDLLMQGGEGLNGTQAVVRFLSRVKSVSGNKIALERPLPYDVRTEWTPEIHRFAPGMQEFGVEHLSIEFPWSPYPGHFKEKGFNALTLEEVSNCWIRDVEIQNADFGIGLDGTNFCTVDGVRLKTSSRREVGGESKGANGHHGITVGHGTENLITNFDVQTTFVHDIAVEWFGLHTVYSKGRGVDLNMDHHREANHSSLFSDLDCGLGTRPFESGGSHDLGPHAGAYTTYWNIRADSAMTYPKPDFGALLNFVGFFGASAPLPSGNRWNVERIDPVDICPRDLSSAMLERRLAKR